MEGNAPARNGVVRQKAKKNPDALLRGGGGRVFLFYSLEISSAVTSGRACSPFSVMYLKSALGRSLK